MVVMEDEGDCRRGRWSVRRVLLRDWGHGLGFCVLGAGLWPRMAADVGRVCSKGGRRRWNWAQWLASKVTSALQSTAYLSIKSTEFQIFCLWMVRQMYLEEFSGRAFLAVRNEEKIMLAICAASQSSNRRWRASKSDISISQLLWCDVSTARYRCPACTTRPQRSIASGFCSLERKQTTDASPSTVCLTRATPFSFST